MIHSILRQSTGELHKSLETKLRVLLSREISLDQYRTIHKKFYGYYMPIEGRLFSISGLDEPELRLEDRRKVPLLMRDLESLEVDRDELARAPLCDRLPKLESISEALGCLYVLEGSTLGGKIITSHLTKVLPLDEIRGCSFFNSYGVNVGPMWSSFLRILARHCETCGQPDAVVHSACETFASLDRWISDAA